MTTGKAIALTRWTFVSKVMSLLFKMLSRFVTDFLPRSKYLLISWLQSLSQWSLWNLAKVKVARLCLTLCDPMDCSLPGSSVHGILQARILEWIAVPFSRGSSQPRHWTQVSHIAGGFFTKLQLGNLSLLQGIFLTQGLIRVSWTAGEFFTSWGT